MPYIDLEALAQIETGQDTDAASISWHSVGHSHVGRVRSLNEDAFFNSAELGLWAVADGMGGHSRGDYASKVVVESLVHFAKQKTLAESIVNLEVRFREAHHICRNTFSGKRVGSTVAALFSFGRYCFCLWAGDSRIYRLRGENLELMTSDHTVAQEKCTRGELSPEKVASHPSAHVLTRAVGVHQTLHLDLHFDLVQHGDRYLICSDGLYNDLALSDIQQLLGSATAQQGLDALVDKAMDKGGRDNITAIIVDAETKT
ncbi:protein phosphatase [Alteromonadaceae bacterium Bs31]|nr:protein phosphatase [Alteromonadaceae bacterium Bs31]